MLGAGNIPKQNFSIIWKTSQAIVGALTARHLSANPHGCTTATAPITTGLPTMVSQSGYTMAHPGINQRRLYPRSDGYQYSTHKPTMTAQVAGICYRYNGDTNTGLAAWFFDGTTNVQIGLTSGEFTRSSDGVIIDSLFRT